MNNCKYIIFLFFSFLFLSPNLNEESLNLGRDNDPRVVEDISKYKLFYRKSIWNLLSFFGGRNISSLAFPKSISYFNSSNKVALTIDDGFCGIDNPDGDMTREIADLLKKYNAKATFFVTGSHLLNTKESDIVNLLKNGNEIANHNMYDIPYKNIPINQFENDLIETKSILNKFSKNLPKWYRAPHASISDDMHEIIKKHNLKHVVGDVFANDTSIPDANWISSFILKNVKPGSVIIIHMPEKGIREWNYLALENILNGLKERKLEIVTLTELEQKSAK